MIAAAPLYLYCEAVSGNDDSTIFVLQQRFGLKKSSVTFAVSFCNNYMSGLLRIMWWRGSCVWIINASVSPPGPAVIVASFDTLLASLQSLAEAAAEAGRWYASKSYIMHPVDRPLARVRFYPEDTKYQI